MVNYNASDLDAVFSALSDATRRDILAHLGDGEATVGELAEPYGISLPAVSRHLKVLEQAGLLERNREGRIHRCRLNPAPLHRAQDWLAGYRQFWEARLDALEDFLDNPQHEPPGEDTTCRQRSKPSRPSSSPAASGQRLARSSRRGRARRR